MRFKEYTNFRSRCTNYKLLDQPKISLSENAGFFVIYGVITCVNFMCREVKRGKRY